MARYQNGAHGPFHGKLGNLVGGMWKGIPYMRTRPRRRAKPSEDELLNREKFATLHQWLRPLIYAIRIGFKGYTPTVEGYNAAKSYNLKNAFSLVNGKYELDPARVMLSHGDLPLAENFSCALSGNELHVTWELDPRANNFDRVMVVAYTPGRTHNRNFNKDAWRKDKKAIVDLRSPGIYHVYLFFFADDRSAQSNSVYLGVVEVG